VPIVLKSGSLNLLEHSLSRAVMGLLHLYLYILYFAQGLHKCVGKNYEEFTGFCTHKKSTTILLRRGDFNLKLILNFSVPNGQQKIYPNELKPIIFLRIDFFIFQLHKSTYNIAF
jgi:hypothetical protein